MRRERRGGKSYRVRQSLNAKNGVFLASGVSMYMSCIIKVS